MTVLGKPAGEANARSALQAVHRRDGGGFRDRPCISPGPAGDWRCLVLAAMLVLLLGFGAGTARAVDYRQEYEKKIKAATAVAALQVDQASGEMVSLYDGRLEFRVVDIDLPGNSALPVQLARKWKHDRQARVAPRAFDDWDLDLPYISGIFAAGKGWSLPSDGRCSAAARALASPSGYYASAIQPLGDQAQAQWNHYVYFEPRLFWHGYSLNVQGAERNLMIRHPGNPNVPSAAYTWVAQDDWVFSCIPANSGEGFLGLDSQGNKYYFNHLASLPYEPVHQAVANPYTPPCELGCGYPRYVDAPLAPRLARSEIRLYATRVEDRFGNWVTYDYDAHRLTRIRANDGREIWLGYDARGVVSQASAAGRRWIYAYQQVNAPIDRSDRVLKSVTLPDGSAWNYSLEQLGYAEAVLMADDGWRRDETDCGQLGPEPGLFNGNAVFTGSVTAPSGARYEYRARPTRHHLTFVDEDLLNSGICYSGFAIPRLFDVVSLAERSVTGPGLAALKWTYAYPQPRATFRHECLQDPSICSDRKSVQVAGPDGTLTTYQFGAMRNENAGMLLSEQIANKGVVYRSATQAYQADPTGQPYPALIGWPTGESYYSVEGLPLAGRNRPLKRISVMQDGVSFQRDTTAFDRFARPLGVTRYSSLGFSRTDTTQYADDLSKWVLGQVSRETNLDTGKIVSRTEFDPANGLPTARYRFGKLQELLAYNSDGTLASVTNGRYLTIKLSDWKRGIAQTIRYPATPESPTGSSSSVTVNDSGWITSAIDENGFITGYGYDAMGRVASLAHPSGDTTAWNTISQTFRQINASDRGLPPGHWEQVRSEGARRTHTYYDGLWRPVMVLDYDASDASRQTQTITRYDVNGRVAFQSYPARQVADFRAALPGTATLYDALGRVTEVRQDSEHGYLYSTTQYLPGFQTRTRNPRGFETLTVYEAYDQPSYDMPRASNHPEGASSEIFRNKFGQPVSLLRRSADFSAGVWRQYVYDTNQQLCKIVEPETGATVMDYDPAGNLAWSASGLFLPDLKQCNRNEAAASGRAITRTHDARNRLTSLVFPDGNGSQSWSYTPDGLPAQIKTLNKGEGDLEVVNRYSYNKRRLLTAETLTPTGVATWASEYGYDGNGNLRWHTYPTGLSLDYAPNALGQPTRVTSQFDTFAKDVRYYPNGAVAQFIYGNGLVHRMTQNARQLPRGINNGTVDLLYDYDNNGNPVAIRDVNAVQGAYSGNRDLGYDGLDRLTSAHLHWRLSQSFAYDVFDNIRRKSDTSGAIRAYWYDANNRLTNVRNESGASIAGFGYDVQGNLQNNSGQTYVFDYGNRLRQVVGKERYRYDGHGRRTMAVRSAGTYSLSMYNQMGLLIYGEKHDSPAKATDYVYLGSSLIATRERDWLGSPAKIRYQHTDALGSPTATTDQAGQVIERTHYEPWGAAIGKSLDGVGYTGHVMDGATGLTYMQQRYYDPHIGRFLSVDPVTAYSNGDWRFFNRYAYAFDNPYGFADPDGRQTKAGGERAGRWIRALWENNGNFEKAAAQVNGEGKQRAQIVSVAVDFTAAGVVKDAVEVTAKVANGQDATGQGAGAVFGEIAGQVTERVLDGKIGADAASMAGATVGKVVGDGVESVVNASRNNGSLNNPVNNSPAKPEEALSEPKRRS